MHRIDTKTAQKDKFGAGKNGFTRGNPQTGTPATDLDDDYFDMLQEELCSVVEASGASLEKARHDQLLTALRALLLSRKNPFGDIKSDGTVKTALENLGLGEMPIIAKYGSPMIGELVHWPMQQMPQEIWTDMRMEFIPYMAQSFDGSKYPLLAQLHPSLRLPADMRGEFVRGWDNGRGINTGQQLMSWSADLFKSHNHTPTNGSFFTFVATGGGQLVNGSNNPNVAIVPTTNSVGGAETRPRSVAWNFIVRAK
ncbi:TPA: integrase [Escherichia coli]